MSTDRIEPSVVFVVLKGSCDYCDCGLVGVYGTRASAEKAASQHVSSEIEEVTIDD